MGKKIHLIARHCLDLVLFGGLCCTFYAIHKWATPQRRGFFCNDDSLQYPYRPSIVNVTTMVSVVLLVPLLVMLAVEFLQLSVYDYYDNSHKKAKRDQKNMTANCCRRLTRCYAHYGYYLFGMALTLIAMEVTKVSVGRLRPHFFAVCQPKLANGSSCADASQHGRYILDYTCNAAPNVTQQMLRELSLSFPSGHASIFFYAMVYLALYLQVMLSLRVAKLFKHLLQFVCLLGAWYVSLTRISDYKHHWTDVAAGMLLGSFCAVSVATFVARFFQLQLAAVNVPDELAELGVARASSTPRAHKLTHTTAAVLPAYTFGTMPYLPAQTSLPSHHQYAGHTYHNYGYVP